MEWDKMDLLTRILSALEEGNKVEITPIGSSMFPLFDKERDQAILAAVDRTKLHRGDVVLYQRDSGMLVLHRIWKIKEDGFYMVGDNQVKIEGPLQAEQIKAIMVSFCRKGKRISCQNVVYRVLSYLWLCFRPIRHIISRPLGILYRFFMKKQ